MKRYKLLKDLPFAKAGEELYLKFSEDSEFFLVYKGTDKAYTAELNPEFIDNFGEWFEELPKCYFSINKFKKEVQKVIVGYHSNWVIESLKSIGLLFETEEEAEKYLEYLKVKEVIKKDTKGFKPDWSDEEQPKHYGYCNAESKRLWRDVEYTEKRSTIYFRSIKDIEESLENHPEEWKTYLTYEQ
jgi:hypothetical protein